MQQVIDFKNSKANYMKRFISVNPGEKAVNSKEYYDILGGDDVVSVGLYQPGDRGPLIQTTNYLTRYRNKRPVGTRCLPLLT